MLPVHVVRASSHLMHAYPGQKSQLATAGAVNSVLLPTHEGDRTIEVRDLVLHTGKIAEGKRGESLVQLQPVVV